MMVIRSVCIQCALRHITQTQSAHQQPPFSLRPSLPIWSTYFHPAHIFITNIDQRSFLALCLSVCLAILYFCLCAIAVALCTGMLCCEHLDTLLTRCVNVSSNWLKPIGCICWTFLRCVLGCSVVST